MGFHLNLNHWLLLQMKPNSHPEVRTFGESKVSTKSKPITQLWHQNGRCPEGTIPIRRTRTSDILRASSVQQFGKKKHKSFPQPRSAKPQPDLITQSGHQVLPLYYHDTYNAAAASCCSALWKSMVFTQPLFHNPHIFHMSLSVWNRSLLF